MEKEPAGACIKCHKPIDPKYKYCNNWCADPILVRIGVINISDVEPTPGTKKALDAIENAFNNYPILHKIVPPVLLTGSLIFFYWLIKDYIELLILKLS